MQMYNLTGSSFHNLFRNTNFRHLRGTGKILSWLEVIIMKFLTISSGQEWTRLLALVDSESQINMAPKKSTGEG